MELQIKENGIDFTKLTFSELADICKNNNIALKSNKQNKETLIELLQNEKEL
jgi:hypothetical protein